MLIIYVYGEQHLPYWIFFNKNEKVVIVLQTGSRTSPIYHQRSIYFYHMNHYGILKEHLKVLHKLQPKYFQVALEKLSVLRFSLVEMDTYLPVRFLLFVDTKMMLIENKSDLTKVQVIKNIFYFELSIKPNVDILGIKVSMLKHYDFETIFTSNDVMKILDAIGKGFGYREREYSMEVNAYFGTIITNIAHATPNYGPVNSKFEVGYYRQFFYYP